ncbi:MAG: siphovirus Gp157 family protein [Gaiellaceae bacterium]
MTAVASTTVKLYELVTARDILDQFLVEEEGEETPPIAALFEQLEGDLATKGEHVAKWIREKEREIDALETEEQWLAKKRRARKNAIASSKEYFLGLLVQLGRKELGTATAKLCRQHGAPALVGELTEPQLVGLIAGENDAIAACVKRIPATFVLDRKKALELVKGGTTIEGLAIETREHIRIR